MLIVGIILGILFLVLGITNLIIKFGYESVLPLQLANVVISFPELALEILFIVGGVFLWFDVARQTRIFNGMISIVIGLVAVGIGAYPLLNQLGIINFAIIVPQALLPWLSLVLGGFLIYDNLN